MSDVETSGGIPGGGEVMDTKSVRGQIAKFVARRQITSFFVIAFAWTWTYDLILYAFVTKSPGVIPPWTAPGTWGPLIAAIIVTQLSGGDLRAWAGQLLNWRVKPRWFVLALLIPIAADELGAVVAASFGYRLTFLVRPAWQYVAHFLLVLLFAGALEEFGWRGFAQPRLQERYSAASAAVVIGVVWACWHLPLFLLFDAAAYDAGSFVGYYLPWVVALSVILAASFNAARGSVLPAMVMHAANNSAGLLQVHGDVQGVANLITEAAGPGVYWAVALGLIVAYGVPYVAPHSPAPSIPGFPSTASDSE